MPQLFTNNARALLTAGITSVATSITIEAAKADLFPTANTGTGSVPATTDWFKLTLQDATGAVEIVYVRSRAAASGVLTNVIRGQEGTTAAAWSAGTVAGLRITAADVEGSISGTIPVSRGGTGATTVAAARTALGSTTVGDAVFTAADEEAAQTTLGGTTVGKAVFTAADEEAAQTTLGGTTVGKALFTAADEAAARSAVGATATGSSLMTASDEAAVFTAVKQAASESETGVVELATTAEAEAGTDTTRAVTPAGVAAAVAALAPPAVVSMANTETLAAGTTVRSSYNETTSRTGNIFIAVATLGFVQSGTVRITLEHRTPTGADNSEARVVRARSGTDTTIQTWSTSSSTFQSRSVDVSVIPGDSLRVQQRNTSASSSTEIRNVRLQTNGEVWWPGVTDARVQ
jgi:hypothetical protein